MPICSSAPVPRAFVAICMLGLGCARVDATVQVLNGPTGGAPESSTARVAAAAETITGPGTYALTPSTMTLTVTGIAFLGAGEDPDRVRVNPVTGCTATYDRALGSLEPLGACGVSVAAGTYDGVVVRFDTRFDMVVDDEAAGIWSDPDAPGLLTATRPEGGARAISVVDQNTDATGGFANLYFDAPLTLGEGDTPEVFVLFDPTHWMKSRHDGIAFAQPYAAGSPPILPSVDGFAKAAYYSNVGTSGSYRWDGCSIDQCTSLLFLYADAGTPTTVTWQDHSICPAISGDMAPVVAFDGDSERWGTYGRLGRDAAGTLAWASADQRSEGGSDITGYNGVYRMPEATAAGGVVDLEYRCTAEVPPPTSGDTYSSGAPEFAPEGTVELTLLY